MGTQSDVTFYGMARALPARTALFTFGPPAFWLLQLVNGYLNGGSLPLIGVLGVVMLAFTVLVTRYNMAVYQLSRLGHPVR